mgnify:CR=1 FL=1
MSAQKFRGKYRIPSARLKGYDYASNGAYFTNGTINRVSTGGITGENNPMFHENISRVVRWYKGRCTFEINKKYPDINFGWQSRFHDHIIRNEKSLENIRCYIINNPNMWQRDRNNKDGIWI